MVGARQFEEPTTVRNKIDCSHCIPLVPEACRHLRWSVNGPAVAAGRATPPPRPCRPGTPITASRLADAQPTLPPAQLRPPAPPPTLASIFRNGRTVIFGRLLIFCCWMGVRGHRLSVVCRCSESSVVRMWWSGQGTGSAQRRPCAVMIVWAQGHVWSMCRTRRRAVVPGRQAVRRGRRGRCW